MNCEELRETYELYAMGVAGEPERSEIREHLNRGCEVCMAGMKQAKKVAALLSGAADPAAPSPKLRKRILASAGFDQRSYGWAPYLAAAAAMFLFAAVYFNARERSYERELASMRDQVRRQTVELTHLNEAMAILSGTGTREVDFTTGTAGRVFVNRSQGVLLVASHLSTAPAGKIYEMWVIPNGGKGRPAPAGLFQPEANGSAMHIQPGPVDPNVVVAVTVENEGGAAQPTSAVIIAAPVQ